jgi:hypothetical protein
VPGPTSGAVEGAGVRCSPRGWCRVWSEGVAAAADEEMGRDRSGGDDKRMQARGGDGRSS